MPDVPVFAGGAARAIELTGSVDGGEAITLETAGRGAGDAARLQAMFTAARLKHCAAGEGYAELVFAELHGTDEEAAP